jgi:hypothetical protein
MKKIILLVPFVGMLSLLAQTAPVPPAAQSQPAGVPANQGEMGAPMFSNQTGQSFSVDELAGQLQNLRTAVEQTLPVLAAFNQNYSNAFTGQSIGGKISGLLSGALNRNQQNTPAASGQNALSVSNVVTALQGLLNTNRAAASSVNPNTVRELIALQNDLQPVVSILQNLNVGNISTNQFPRPYNITPLSTNQLTPTGR